MTFPDFDTYFDDLVEKCRGMRDSKGKEYAGTMDRFGNFNRLAVKTGVSRLVVANVYLSKHMDAIDSYIREGTEFSTETVEGRIVDAITYLSLIGGMIKESKVGTQKKPHSENHRFVPSSSNPSICSTCLLNSMDKELKSSE